MEDHDQELAQRKIFVNGKWRIEAEADRETGELDSRGVVVVPGPPAELEGQNTGESSR